MSPARGADTGRLELTTTSPVQTRAVGAGIARVLRAGDVVLLLGSLGAGKTTLVQGLVAGLGGHEAVTSPTFTLAHRYRSTPPVTHVDLWRLEHLQEVVDLALEEELEDGVVVLEWGDAAEALYGADALVVGLEWGNGEGERLISLDARGETWTSRLEAELAEAGGLAGAPRLRRGGGFDVLILAIETATIEVGVAVGDETGPIATLTVRPGRRQAETLHPAIADLCRTARVAFAELDAVAVDIGPGLFTGLRVGVAAAKALAAGLGLPVVTARSLDVLQAACPGGPALVVPVLDMRRGEVAWQLPARPTEPDSPATVRVGRAGELGDELDRLAAPVLLVGDGALRHRAELGGHGSPPPVFAGIELAAPPVASLVVLAVEAMGNGAFSDPAAVRAFYGREADARINWASRRGREPVS